MGHKKNRKQQRRGQRWNDAPLQDELGWRQPNTVGSDFLVLIGATLDSASPATSRCGDCREFVEDQEGGRGTCLHPGSGVLAPWSDTEACAFFDGRRGARSAQRRADSWGA